VMVGNRAPPHGGVSRGALPSASDDDGGGFQARCAKAQDQWGRVCHSQASPKIGSTSGTKP
jgi:hypothetical protein